MATRTLSQNQLDGIRSDAQRVIDDPASAKFYADRGDAGVPDLVRQAETIIELLDELQRLQAS